MFLAEDGMMPLTPIDAVAAKSESDNPVGANPRCGGQLGVAAAARWGLSEWTADEEIEIDPELLRSAVWNLVSYASDFDQLAGVTTRNTAEGDFPTEFHRTRFGLTDVYEFGPERPASLVVWGDSPTDFLAWDRTYHSGVWVPDEWWHDADTHRAVIWALGVLGSGLRINGRGIVFTSTSLNEAELAERLETCQAQALCRSLETTQAIPANRIEYPRFYKSHLAISGRYSNEWSTTVLQDADGTIDFAMLPPSPLIGVTALENIENRAQWHVDLQIRNHYIPTTIAIPDQDLLAGGRSEAFDVRIRTGRSGISFGSHRTGFVSSEASVEQKLSRPFVRYPSARGRGPEPTYTACRFSCHKPVRRRSSLRRCWVDEANSPNWSQDLSCPHSKHSTPQERRATRFRPAADALSATRAT